MKQILSIFAVLLILTGCSANQDNSNKFITDGIAYSILSEETLDAASRQMMKTVEVIDINEVDSSLSYNGRIVIPESVTHDNTKYVVTRIGDKAFKDCNGVMSVSMPSTIGVIEEDAFSGTPFVEFTVTEGVEAIGKGAFSNCKNLKIVNFPASLEFIGYTHLSKRKNGFEYEKTTFSMPQNVFEGCENLMAVNVAEGNPVFSSRDGLLFNKEQTEFLYCPAAFDGIYLPATVSKINSGAFAQSEKLGIIMLDSPVPPEVINNTFTATMFEKMQLMIPAKSIDLYKKSEIWKEFKNIEPINEKYRQ